MWDTLRVQRSSLVLSQKYLFTKVGIETNQPWKSHEYSVDRGHFDALDLLLLAEESNQIPLVCFDVML